MHPAIQMLADKFGVRIAERCASDSWQFDGESIATTHRKYTSIIHNSDHDLLHEIAHYAVAAPEQRDLPEYGLALAIVPGQCYGHFRNPDGTIDGKFSQVAGGLVDDDEQKIQEHMAQLLCVHWGMVYGISPVLSSEPSARITASWEAYLLYKIDEAGNTFWLAMIRLREQGLIEEGVS